MCANYIYEKRGSAHGPDSQDWAPSGATDRAALEQFPEKLVQQWDEWRNFPIPVREFARRSSERELSAPNAFRGSDRRFHIMRPRDRRDRQFASSS